ncbi:hypothetical protein F2Q70_00023295 [Brassica cretica]|uniref:Uncharacterized protein n=2 Tax=Brassica cretica TaxID=69181 RepID=A0A8S9GS37_BRACR|nr:hypothetical protein F2Q70_00023295 [Brassica cretica]KAF2557358.1 hypothetical protein F2Q68_00017570 [Brassica cretica]KAF3605595.1 hypothetical protein DY000_02050393 [Brassica cretica]
MMDDEVLWCVDLLQEVSCPPLMNTTAVVQGLTSILSDGLANFKIAGDRSDLIATERLDLVVQSSALENYVG